MTESMSTVAEQQPRLAKDAHVGERDHDRKPDRRTTEHSIDDWQTCDAFWRAANYLTVGQIYLLDNPLLKEPLRSEHVKPRLLGHWGTSPGLNLVYAHVNRAILKHDWDAIFLAGPGHGGPAVVANVYLEGTYSEYYPEITLDAEGMRRLFRQFSFPGGIPSHVAAATPGSIHEGGELGYVLSHAFGAVMDHPDLVAIAVVGDGEAETGPLATSWHSNKFLNPRSDGIVVPVLHLNGYKIAGPTVLARLPHAELESLLRGHGYDPIFVEGHEPESMHRQMMQAIDRVAHRIDQIRHDSRVENALTRPNYPMIVLRSPKGWTCPETIDSVPCEGSWRSHQVPMKAVRENESHRQTLQQWMRSYRPDELFEADGRPKDVLRALCPSGTRRMGDQPIANGSRRVRPLRLAHPNDFAVEVQNPGAVDAEATRVQGRYLAEVMRRNLSSRNFRVFSPDENASNRWTNLFDVTERMFNGIIREDDDHMSRNGRVMEMLSEHQCQGWLEGYLLTGRHGFFNCYEAFIHIVDSMFNQHAKWLKESKAIDWRGQIPSLNYLLSSHVWRQDHNGYSHQDPGFLDHVVNKKAELIRVYLPPDANCLLSTTHHCLQTRHRVNVIVAGKQPMPQWLTMDHADKHCESGLGIWSWASSDGDRSPDIVMACCGDVPTLETLAAVDLLRKTLPNIRVRVVNIVDLMKLQPPEVHPSGLSDRDFDHIFPPGCPVVFAFHGYPWLIHRLMYRRHCHDRLHVRGYVEEGTTTTPFDMVAMNGLDRFSLITDVVDRVDRQIPSAGKLKQRLHEKLLDHRHYIRAHGIDMPEIRHWRWGEAAAITW